MIRTVERVIDETPTVRTLIFSDDVMAGVLPGQFAMVWVPGTGELPMSVMVVPGGGRAAFTVRRHGPASTGLYNVRAGQKIGVRGPYGNSFDMKTGRIMLVGGGTGMVPLMRMLAHVGAGHDVTVLIGARTAREVFFEDTADSMLEKIPHRVLVSTEDGTRGRQGLVTELARKLMSESRYDAVYTCGPELMMHRTVQIAHSMGIFVQASIERVMKCGVGICGSCCMGEDLICHDGTVFDGGHLLSNPEFGRTYRNKAGMPQDYQAPA